jgi:nicotinamidase-related amidase
MQRIFADPASDWFAPRFAEIVPAVAKLAQALQPRVTFTRFVAPARPARAWRDYYQRWPFALQPPDAPAYALVDDFAASAGPTLDATTFGKWQAGLAGLAAPSGRLVLAGVSTDCCVLSTALAAADDGIAVQVAADACAAGSDEDHARSLAAMRLYEPLIEIVTVADVLSEAALLAAGE